MWEPMVPERVCVSGNSRRCLYQLVLQQDSSVPRHPEEFLAAAGTCSWYRCLQPGLAIGTGSAVKEPGRSCCPWWSPLFPPKESFDGSISVPAVFLASVHPQMSGACVHRISSAPEEQVLLNTGQWDNQIRWTQHLSGWSNGRRGCIQSILSSEPQVWALMLRQV